MSSTSLNSLSSQSESSRFDRVVTLALVAILLPTLFLLFSPNFQADVAVRLSPLGSDFLQEWSGGHIWRSKMRSQLYVAEHFQQVQHDASLLGFTWPETQFYPMVYPPFYYMLLSPLSSLPYQIATIIWMAAISIAILASVFLWTEFYPPAKRHWGKCLLATIVFFPVLLSINTAHKSAFLLLILASSYLLLFHKRPGYAGLVFGLIAFKPHLGLVIGFTMLFKRQWRFVAGCMTTVVFLIALSLLAGTELCADYFWQCISAGNYATNSGYRLAEAHHMLGALSLTLGTQSTLTTVACFSLTAILLTLVAQSMAGTIETSSPRFALQFSILVFATVLASPHFYPYDLTILLLPMALVFSQAAQVRGTRHVSRRLIVCCLVLYGLAGLSTNIAATINIQPTLVLIAAIVYLLNRLILDSHGDTEYASHFAGASNTFAHQLR